MDIYKYSLIALCILVLNGCKPASPEEKAGGGNLALTTGYTLNQSDFNGLSADEQFMVANKALSTMYRGLPLDQFFDLTQGLESPSVQYDNFISSTQVSLQTPLSQLERRNLDARILGLDDDVDTVENDSIQGRFNTFDNDQPHQIYMARMQTYPLSKDQFVTWMSYFLANTIMFSPAREMDSTNSQDIVRVLGYLDGSLNADKPIRDVVRGWLHNLSRWRVSRSPENHALEMFELYLGIFNDTPEEIQNTINGGKACGSWYLTDNNADYQLLIDLTKPEGTKSYEVFGKFVTNCEDLYDVVAGHPRLIPRVIEVIVNYFMDGSSSSVKQDLIQSIVNSNPVTFNDVFLGVMFSKSFLLTSERVKTFEENALGFLNSMYWNPRANSGELGRGAIDSLLDSDRFDSGADIGVHRMGWAAMNYKIGRTPFLPMDVLSFATYHKAIRQEVLMNQRAYDGRSFPKETDFTEADEPRPAPFPIYAGAFYIEGTENLKPELDSLTAEEFIDFVFLTAMGRRATDVEVAAFIAEGDQTNRHYLTTDDDGVVQLRRSGGGVDELYEYWADDFAEIMLDYISRLPEFYYYRPATL